MKCELSTPKACEGHIDACTNCQVGTYATARWFEDRARFRKKIGGGLAELRVIVKDRCADLGVKRAGQAMCVAGRDDPSRAGSRQVVGRVASAQM